MRAVARRGLVTAVIQPRTGAVSCPFVCWRRKASAPAARPGRSGEGTPGTALLCESERERPGAASGGVPCSAQTHRVCVRLPRWGHECRDIPRACGQADEGRGRAANSPCNESLVSTCVSSIIQTSHTSSSATGPPLAPVAPGLGQSGKYAVRNAARAASGRAKRKLSKLCACVWNLEMEIASWTLFLAQLHFVNNSKSCSVNNTRVRSLFLS